VNEQALTAAREQAVQAERTRVSEIQALSVTANRYGIDQTVISKFIADGISIEQARKDLFDKLAALGTQPAADPPGDPGKPPRDRIVTEFSGGTDHKQKRLQCMQAALLLRADPKIMLSRRRDINGNETQEFIDGCGPEQHKKAVLMAREYRNFKLMDMAKEYVELGGTNTRGMDVTRIADIALQGPSRGAEFFDAGGESTSDFPAILANVANKTLRVASVADRRLSDTGLTALRTMNGATQSRPRRASSAAMA